MKVKHLTQDCPAPLCSNCGKDHHRRTEQNLHKAQGDEEDDDGGSEDDDYYQGGDLFDEDQQFHFNQGPEYDDGDDYQDHYQSDDSRGEETDRDESTLNVERTMFAKSFGSGNNLGDGMLKSSLNDNGSKPAKHEASNTTDNVQISTKSNNR